MAFIMTIPELVVVEARPGRPGSAAHNHLIQREFYHAFRILHDKKTARDPGKG
jgi:hypothetical protein